MLLREAVGTVPEMGATARETPGLSPVSRSAAKPHICFVAPTAWPLFSGNLDIPVVGGA